jgi:hypothetical protein
LWSRIFTTVRGWRSDCASASPRARDPAAYPRDRHTVAAHPWRQIEKKISNIRGILKVCAVKAGKGAYGYNAAAAKGIVTTATAAEQPNTVPGQGNGRRNTAVTPSSGYFPVVGSWCASPFSRRVILA